MRHASSICALVVTASAIAVAFPSWAGDDAKAAAEIKFGTLAPDNSPWSDILKSFKKNLQKETEGKLKVKLYLNGVLGDEAAMLQKIKFGQLTGGGFSTGGVATVIPEFQIFEIPFLFESDAEADYIMDEVVLDDMRKLAEARGMYLYIWAVNGWVDIATKEKPFKTFADLKGQRMHMQETDVQREFWKSVGANPVPMAVPDVLNGLQRGMLDGFSSTPVFGTATQWTTQAKNWTDTNHIYQPAAVLFDLKWWNALPDDVRKKVLAFAPELQKTARKNVRGIDDELFSEMKKNGMQTYTLPPAERDAMKKATAGVGAKLAAQGAFPKALYDKVQKGLADYRAKHK